MIKTNYHTHTTFCDGKNTVSEMAAEAVKRKFDILGFSSHSMGKFSDPWHLRVEEHAEYAAEVRRVADEMRGKLCVQLGFEVDYIRGLCSPNREDFAEFKPDYIIGAVHFVMNENGCFAVDDARENVQNGIDKFFGGDKRAVVHSYFENEREMLAKGGFDIIAHADLVRKHNSSLALFDEESAEYKDELKLTAKAIQKAGVIAEVNTGAMARGYLSVPYPSPYFLSLLFELGVPVTFSADAHAAENLDFGYDAALAHIKNAGYKEIAYLESSTVKFQKL